jgi:archaellum component FlaG (FlaF/FlaG flagellin family)
MNEKKLSLMLLLILITVALTLSLTAYAATQTTLSASVPSSGAIKKSANLELYTDSACKNVLNNIAWGDFTPGSNATQTIYIKNTGSHAFLTLTMSTYDWTPRSTNAVITVSWNQEGTRLSPGQVVAAVITTSVSSNIMDTSDFSFKLCINGA